MQWKAVTTKDLSSLTSVSQALSNRTDIVLFLYRDAYYNKESEKQNIAECIVAKNRHGETGTVELIWDGQFTRFANVDYTPRTR